MAENKKKKQTPSEKFYNDVGYNRYVKQQVGKGNMDYMSKAEYKKKKSTKQAVSDAKGTTKKKK